MRKCITIFLVFIAGFLASFNIVRNLNTIRNHQQEDVVVEDSAFPEAVSKATTLTTNSEGRKEKPFLFENKYTRSSVHEDDQLPPPSPPPPLPVSTYTRCEDETCGTDRKLLPCHKETHAEYWGDVVKWGDKHFTETAEACCDACKNFKPARPGDDTCNTWVWCPNPNGCSNQKYKSCWLKYQAHPEAPAVNRGETIQWTSGSLFKDPDRSPRKPGENRKFHVAVTSNDSKYVQWQMRVMYYWYKKRKAEQGPDGDMGGFTRILHSGRPDHLMKEIPTVVVDRLSNEYGFVVLSRPNAFVQWLKKVTIEEDYVLMSEPDHLYLKPIPNLMDGRRPAAFPFFYISPKEHPKLIRKYVGDITTKQIQQMDPIGSSPVMLHKDDLAKVAPRWHELAVKMKTDPEADRAWGWVLEMWAYTCAAWIEDVHHDLVPKLAAQPPWDTTLDGFYMLHYTYGNDYSLDGKFTPGKIGQWRFDKRSYMGRIPAKNLTLPPKGAASSVRTLIEMINEASAVLPRWEQGG